MGRVERDDGESAHTHTHKNDAGRGDVERGWGERRERMGRAEREDGESGERGWGERRERMRRAEREDGERGERG